MSYRETARAFAAAEYGAAVSGAHDRLPMSEWAESRRADMTPQTIAHNHALHVSDMAHALREALKKADGHADPMGRLAALADVEDAARALLAAIGEGEAGA